MRRGQFIIFLLLTNKLSLVDSFLNIKINPIRNIGNEINNPTTAAPTPEAGPDGSNKIVQDIAIKKIRILE